MNNASGYALLALGVIGLVGMIAVFMTARLNDKLDAKAMSARQSQDPSGLGPKDASAVAIGDLPEPSTQTHTTKKKGE